MAIKTQYKVIFCGPQDIQKQLNTAAMDHFKPILGPSAGPGDSKFMMVICERPVTADQPFTEG
jgi:hypothetical protein